MLLIFFDFPFLTIFFSLFLAIFLFYVFGDFFFLAIFFFSYRHMWAGKKKMARNKKMTKNGKKKMAKNVGKKKWLKFLLSYKNADQKKKKLSEKCFYTFLSKKYFLAIFFSDVFGHFFIFHFWPSFFFWPFFFFLSTYVGRKEKNGQKEKNGPKWKRKKCSKT